jgi:hypothetical protein
MEDVSGVWIRSKCFLSADEEVEEFEEAEMRQIFIHAHDEDGTVALRLQFRVEKPRTATYTSIAHLSSCCEMLVHSTEDAMLNPDQLRQSVAGWACF